MHYNQSKGYLVSVEVCLIEMKIRDKMKWHIVGGEKMAGCNPEK